MVEIVKDSDRKAHQLWEDGQRDDAIRAVLARLDASAVPSVVHLTQATYYLFMTHHFEVAIALLRKALKHHPDHLLLTQNLGAALGRTHQYAEAFAVLEHYLELGGRDAGVFDTLTASAQAIGDLVKARDYGARALSAKEEATRPRWGRPKLRKVAGADRRASIISFALWGSDPRYLRSALDNVIEAKRLYPGWTCRFYLDDSVDGALRDLLAELGADLRLDDSGETGNSHRLTRRFAVADDPSVGRFMVRDADSVVGEREAAAVAEWIESGLPFHVMRDWWTHTDPMLAGMWGGIATAFPGMMAKVAAMRASSHETLTWDQWFLRDQVWPAIRDHCLVHDRCFASHAAKPWPTPAPGRRIHVGQNEILADPAGQMNRLAPYAARVPALGFSNQAVDVGAMIKGD